MAEQIWLHLKQFDKSLDKSADVDWLIADAAGQQLSQVQRCSLELLGSKAAGKEIIIVLAAQCVTLTTSTVPGKQKKKIEKVVAYALEEQLATDIEKLHFAIASKYETQDVPVAICDRKAMSLLIEIAEQCNLNIKSIISEVHAIAHHDKEWTLFITEERVIIRSDSWLGMGCELAMLKDVLSIMLEDTKTKPSIRLVNFDTQLAQQVAQTLSDLDLRIALNACPQQALFSYLQHGNQNASINLLQGDFSIAKQHSTAWKTWRFAALFAGIWLISGVISSVLNYQQLNARYSVLQTATNETAKYALRGINYIDPIEGLEKRLKTLRKGGSTKSLGFTNMLTAISPILKRYILELKSMSWRTQQMDLKLKVASLSKLEQLQTELSKIDGIKVELKTTTPGKGFVESTLKLKY